MKLAELLEGVEGCEWVGDPGTEIEAIAYDSRKVRPGTLFVALKGHREDGHSYIQDAVRRGAAAVVAERVPAGLSVTRIRVADPKRMLSLLALRFYGQPFRGISLVGVTGTNGKTTTTFLLESILLKAGAKPGVIGTINYRYGGKSMVAPVTTPESLDLLAMGREMADASVTHLIMEVSSHALDQRRVCDCPFRTAVFTNLSRDHLDYHKGMEEYFQAKSVLFKDLLGREGTAVINLDDPRGRPLAALTRARVLTFGLRGETDFRVHSVRMDLGGVRASLVTPVGEREIRSPLIGEFNVSNILAAAAAAFSLGVGLDAVAEGIEALPFVPGRLEMVRNHRGLAIVVDYAHTPDALQKTLHVLKPHVQGRVITVFGCGGDRDKGKRAEMGAIAAGASDLVFVTSDNPRSEDPLSIILQIEEGVARSPLRRLDWQDGAHGGSSGYFVEADRREAIRKAVSIATPDDLILIAGKGHEEYQIIGKERRHFDDRKEAALATLGAAA